MAISDATGDAGDFALGEASRYVPQFGASIGNIDAIEFGNTGSFQSYYTQIQSPAGNPIFLISFANCFDNPPAHIS